MPQMTMLTESLQRPWLHVSSSDVRGLALFRRHYSHNRNGVRPPAPKGNQARYAGPGEVMVLLTPACDALFVWRRERYRRDVQTGINCTIFRNEGSGLSSELITHACEMAWERWPGERLFTFVDGRHVRSTNPGYCFLKAGWSRCGRTKYKNLEILERLPA